MGARQQWILRKGTPRSGFRYEYESGAKVADRKTLERIDALRIPPAWKDVHIARSARARIQAWGYDSRGRKQYRYHERAVLRRELRKYHRVRQLARDLPDIRRRVDRDWRRRELSRERLAAAVVRLIEEGFFRIGSERYLRENRTMGLVTLGKRHVRVEPEGVIRFEYRGKGAKRQQQTVVDAELARFLERLMRKTPGRRLFRYRGDDGWENLTARDVNEYLHGTVGVPYTAKDFRTLGGTLRMATVLADIGPGKSEREAEKNVVLANRLVAAELGNTPAICRKSYVHPQVIARYVDEGITIAEDVERARPASRRRHAHTPEERALLRFFERYFPERRRRPRDGDEEDEGRARRGED